MMKRLVMARLACQLCEEQLCKNMFENIVNFIAKYQNYLSQAQEI